MLPNRDGRNPQDPVYHNRWNKLCGVGLGPRVQWTDGCPLSTRDQQAKGVGTHVLKDQLARKGREGLWRLGLPGRGRWEGTALQGWLDWRV